MERQWYQADVGKAEVATLLFGAVSNIDTMTMADRFANLMYAKMASGRDLTNIYGLSLTRGNRGFSASGINDFEAASVGLVQETIETLTSRIGKNRPWVTITTNAGSYKQRRRGKLLSRYIDGLFYENGIFDLLPDVFRDMLTWGLGVVHTYEEDGKICSERVIPDELRVDNADAIMGRPRSIHRVKFVPKARLIAQYPDHRDEILASSGAYPGILAGGSQLLGFEQFAVVTESHHLPSAPGKKDGRHTVIVGANLVLSDDQKFDGDFPYAFLRGYPTGTGFWPQGVVEQAVPYIARLSRLNRTIGDAITRVGAPKWVVPKGANVAPAALSNKVAVQVEYTGPTPPACITPPAISAQVLAERDWWVAAYRSRVGTSQSLIQGTNPLGAGASGSALDAIGDQSEGRFQYLGQRLEECVVHIAKNMLALATSLKPKVMSPGRRGVKLIDWEAAALDLSEAVLQAWPISSLPSTPAGRIKRAKELLDIGQITRDDYARVIGQQDVEAITDPLEAGRDAIEMCLDSICEDDVYLAPEKYMPLDLALSLATARYCRERALGAPDEILDDLSRFIDDVVKLGKPPAQQQPGPELPATAQFAPAAVPGPTAAAPPAA